MRPELPAPIADALARATAPTLAFDLSVIEANLARVAEAARAAGVRVLFAAKSFPHAEVRALAAARLDGFDVASTAELAAVPGARIISIADPTAVALAAAPRTGRVIAVCETPDQARAAPAWAEIAIRISASITGRDPAVGAVLEGSGRRSSRFGLATREAVAEVARAAAGRPLGLHVHHGPVVATSGERFVATARAALALADFAPAFLDLGGAWHGVADLAGALQEVRDAVPAATELVIEPGRLFAERAGFATGRIHVTRELADRTLCVTDLSRTCHLRWSAIDLVARAPRPGAGRITLIAGPTCFEDDALGEWTVEPLGARVMFRDVTGYALGWNAGFAGVPPAEVIVTR